MIKCRNGSKTLEQKLKEKELKDKADLLDRYVIKESLLISQFSKIYRLEDLV